MPLSRYEIRSEYSLANPDLYRVADKDDPEGLLEGVAMAGLVGIIRQLGDLAEFAAEVFHDLHEDVLTIAARGHELLLRVRQLEIEAPLIEKMFISKIDNGQCYYNPGVEWHGHIYNEQNHFTQGDLPRFIRSAYEDCRSPPRLFPLDRFDVAGAGSCLKRFTDPSFFKTEWASTELMKAEKEQRDQKARRMKRKGRRQEYGEARRAKLPSQIQLREPTEVENLETLRTASSASDSSLGFEQGADDAHMQENDDMLVAAGLLVSEPEGSQAKRRSLQDLGVSEPSLDLKMEHSTPDTSRHMDMGVPKDLKDVIEIKEAVTDDSTSETDNFMDAVTTMDSEAETDSEAKGRAEGSGELLVELKKVEASEDWRGTDDEHNSIITSLAAEPCKVADEEQKKTIAPIASDPWKGADEELDVIIAPQASEPWKGADDEHDMTVESEKFSIEEEDKEDIIIEVEFASGNRTPEESSNTDQAYFAANSPGVVVEEEDRSFVNGDVIATSVQGSETSTPNSSSTKFPGIGEDTVSKSIGDDTVSKSIGDDTVSKSIGEDTASRIEGHLSDDAPTIFSVEEEISVVVQSAVVLAVKENLSSLMSQSNASSPGLKEDSAERHLQPESYTSSCYLEENAYSNSGKHLRSGSIGPFLEAPESLVPDKDLPCSNQLPDLDVPDPPPSDTSKGFNQLPDLDVTDPPPSDTSKGFNQLPDLDAPCKDLSPSSSPKSFNQIPESDIPGNTTPKSDSSKDMGAISTRKRWQINKLFTKEFLASDLERETSQVSGSEQGESPRKRSLQSSPSSSIQPMKWAFDSSKIYLTDDELEDMQVSTASPSSSTSTLSSPRPSTLTTTLLNMSLEHKPQESVESFSQSQVSSSPKSGTQIAPHQSTSQMETPTEPLLSPVFERSANSSPHSAKSSSHSSFSAGQQFFGLLPSLAHDVITPFSERSAEAFSAQCLADNNLEVDPPPPPLPPLAWRMTRKTQSTAVNPLKVKESSTSIPIACDVQGSPNDLSQAFTSSTTLPAVTHASSENASMLTHAFSSSTSTFQQSEVVLDESSTYETGISDPEASHERSADKFYGRSADPHQVSKTAESHDREPSLFLDTVKQGTVPAIDSSDHKEEKGVMEGPVSSLLKKFFDYSFRVTSSKQGTISATATPVLKEEKGATEGSVSSLQKKFIDDSSCITLSKQGTSSVMATPDFKEEKAVTEGPFCSLQKKFIEDSSYVTPSEQGTISVTATSDFKEEKGISVMTTSDFREEKGVTEGPISSLQENFIDNSSRAISSKQGTTSLTEASDFKEDEDVKEVPVSSLQEKFIDDSSHDTSSKHGTISVMMALDFKEEKGVTEEPVSSLQKKFSSCVPSSNDLQTGSIPVRLDESKLESQIKGGVEYWSPALQRSGLPHVLSPNLEIKEATTSHDVSRLKRRSTWAWTSSTASSDDREVLLDQIRTKSFSLRNTSREKVAPPRPVTNINVAAILEKANAIRQAFAGSDDDDEWSD